MYAGFACLRLAPQYAYMTRRNDRPPLLIDEGVPLAALILQRAAEDGLHAVACPDRLRLVVRIVTVFKHIARRHRCNSAVAEFALAQLLLGPHAIRDIHQETNHPRGPAARI